MRPPYERPHTSSSSQRSDYRKRRNFDDSPQDHAKFIDPHSPEYLRNLICKIGEKPNEDFSFVAESLLLDYGNLKDEICNDLEICICEFPAKTEIYAKLIAAMNEKNPDFVLQFLYSLQELIAIKYKRSQFNQVILMMRFLLILGALGVVSFSSLLDLLEQFNPKASSLDSAISTLNYRILFATLPFGGKALYEAMPSFIDGLIERFSCSNSNSMELSGKFGEEVDCLTAFWMAFSAVKERTLGFSCSNSTATIQQDLKQIDISSYQPEVGDFLERKFALISLEPQGLLFDRLICYENVLISLELFHFNFKRAIEMISYDMNTNACREREYVFALFSWMIFIGRRRSGSGNSIANVEACITHLCRIRPGVAPFLGKVIRFFFANAQELSHLDIFTFNQWFADHLTNFDLKWNWNEWNPILSDSDSKSNSSRMLVEDLLERLSRLVFPQRILQVLPECYSQLIGECCGSTSVFDTNKWLEDAEIASLIERLRSKVEPQKFLDSSVSLATFTRALLVVGSSSISHCLVLLERYKQVLLALLSQAEGQDSIVYEAIFLHWKGNVQFWEIFIQRLFLYKLIKPSSFVIWYLPKVQQQLHKSKAWSVILLLRESLALRILQCQEKLTLKETAEEETALISKALEGYKSELERMEKCVLEFIESKTANESFCVLKTCSCMKQIFSSH